VPSNSLRFYDEDDAERVASATSIRTVERQPRQPEVWPADGVAQAESPDWGGLWGALGLAGYSEEHGLVFGFGLRRTGFGFEQDPHRYTLGARAGFATGPQKPIVDVDYELRNLVRHVHLFGNLLYTPIDVLRYSGFGNETESPEDEVFYDPAHTTSQARLGLRIAPNKRLRFDVGGRFRRVDSDTASTMAGLLPQERPYGSGEFQHVSVFGELAWDGRAVPGRPSRGVRVTIGGSASPEGFDLTEGAFGDVHGEVDVTVARRDDLHPQLGIRLGGRKVFGTYPFSEGAFLGGPGSLRGVAIDRYLGDAVVYGSLEARAKFFRANVLVPADYGGLAFVDGGRVFWEGEDSDTWHAGYGGGIWISPAISEYPSLSDLRAIASIAFSDGTHKFYFSAGYPF
jgi:outer membrane protein assembly factor BamA